jgi:3-hydroxyacyl-CoA dehydrogenase
MKRTIRKAAVLGSGVMGSRIACHFAGIGLQVLLLDIVPREAEGSSDPSARNRLVNDALQAAVKSNPSPLYHKEALRRIETGNFDDDLHRIADCDWVIEVVVERLDIKRALFDKVEQHRRKGTLITSNTSGIPIHLMAEGRSDDFRRHFCGTHFFNPPRYLRLLEIIPTPDTDPAVVDFLMTYGDLYLGKTTVLCKDTPAFIANRIGVFGIMAIFRLVDRLGLTVDEVDALTGPVIGRPKSATFRTADVVGIDTMVKVARGVHDNCPHDEARDAFTIPAWLDRMVAQNWLGDKSGQGFFKKTRGAGGEKEILSLDLATLEYGPRRKPKFATVEAAKPIDDLKERLRALCSGMDKAGDFYRHFHYGLFSYISHRIPEVTDEPFRVDDAMMAGFGWEIGAFESWDVLGVARTAEAMKKAGYAVAPWVEAMLAAGHTSFYRVEGGKRLCYSPASGGYVGTAAPGQESAFIVMRHFEGQTVWKNAAARAYHLGDDVLGLEWYTKMGSIGGEVLEGIQQTIALAEEKYRGVVIANEGPNFSAGANVAMIFMLSIEQEWDEMDMAIRQFQHTMLRARYSSVPVVVAPHGLSLGGACELSLHADKVCPAAETYIGLVEVGIGVIPGGGGTKEFALRLADELKEGDIRINAMRERFLTIGQAKVATSGHEAFALGYLRKGQDEVIVSRAHQLAYAKACALELWNKGYTKPAPRKDIKVLGQEGLGIVYVGANSMLSGNYISQHDALISEKLGYVLCGGDLSEATEVSEQYLLDLERKAFVELCMQRKTLERLQSIITSGKVLRN